MRRGLLLPAIAMVLMSAVAVGQQPTTTRPTFQSGVSLVLVDVVVRDRSGTIVKGLTADDFELLEDGARQQIVSFAYEEIASTAVPMASASVLTTTQPQTPTPMATAPPAAADIPARPLTSDEAAGRRLLTLVFDTSSMQPDDVQKAVDEAGKWVADKMTAADLVAVATIGSSLQVLTDFTSSKERVRNVLAGIASTDGTAFDAVDASTAATDQTNQAATSDAGTVDASAQELDTFNNDVRLRALKTLAEALQPIAQKKAIIYFSSGMQRSGTDNQVELRAAVNAAVRANVAIYPVDSRGLQAVIPGGGARQGSRGGLSAFTGAAVAAQFNQLTAQQETLSTLASDTGGTAFTDTNDFGEAFTRVERDISAYYMLGFTSTNTRKDGKYRRITVRVRNRANVKVESKAGYYAERDFAHTTKTDRETALQEQLTTAIPATDVPLFVSAGWFRMNSNRYYVPIAIAVPGSAVPPSAAKGALDIAGFIRDERGVPVGRIRDTITIPAGAAEELASRQIVYQTGVTLPPGHFSIKIAVRENADGQMGTFETTIAVPDLAREPVKVSSLVLSTQVRNVANAKAANPLVHDGLELVPNLTHIVGRDQPLYFYYEVYDPASAAGSPRLRTAVAFYRGKTKVFETPVVERTRVDAADRRATAFQFEIPAGVLAPGLYTCQVSVIDAVAERFVFPRLQMYVR